MPTDSFRTWKLASKTAGKPMIKSTAKGFQCCDDMGEPTSKDDLTLDEARAKLKQDKTAKVANKGPDKKALAIDGYSNNQRGQKRPDKTAKSTAVKGAPRGNSGTKKDLG